MTDTPKPLTSAELADLKAKAKAATPGPWGAIHQDFISRVCSVKTGEPLLEAREQWKDDARRTANVEFVYCANPETILRLIDMIERQREQIDGLRDVVKAGSLLAALVGRPFFKQKCNEALAATEPFNDKR